MPVGNSWQTTQLPSSQGVNPLGTGPRIDTCGRNYAQVTRPHIYISIYVLNENPGFMALGAKTMCHFFGLKCFLETMLSSESLDPLISFLVYLEPKLLLTNQKLDINSNPTKGNLGHFG